MPILTAGYEEGSRDTACTAQVACHGQIRIAEVERARTSAPCGHPCHATARKECSMLIEHVLYRAQAQATGGRDGRAVSSDGALDVQLTTPPELGGAGGRGTNPEQLFAAGYAACFLSAMKYVAARDSLAIPPEIAVEATVRVGTNPQGFG